MIITEKRWQDKGVRTGGLLRLAVLFTMLILFGCAPGHKGADRQMAMGNYHEAIPLLQEYLEGNHDAIRSRNILAYSLLRVGRYEDAITEFNTVLADRANDQYAMLYLGLAYFYNLDTRKTISIWQNYKGGNKPLVAMEVKRQLTLLKTMHGASPGHHDALAADKAIEQALQEEAVRQAVLEAKLGDCG